jgi:PPP family 3-phenylpropionic acid transporter
MRLSALYAALFFVTGIQLPYLPIWLAWVGLTPREIATISACPLLVRTLAMPIIAYAADRRQDHRRFLIILTWALLVALLLLAQMRTFWPIFWCSLLAALAWTSMTPLAETMALGAMTSARLDYGRLRLWGSLGFTAAALLTGWAVAWSDPGAVLGLLLAASGLLALSAHALEPGSARRGPPPRRPPLRLTEALSLLGSRTFLALLLAAGAVQATHAAFYTFGVLNWSRLGISTLVAGLLWTVAVAAEIVVFACSGSLVARLGPVPMLAAGAVAGIVRWSAMGFDPAVWLLFVLQALHGLTFGATHVGAMHALARLAPEGQGATAQALYAAASGILIAAATVLVGPLYADYGGGAYLAMAAMAAVGLAATLMLGRMPATLSRAR